MLMLSANLGDFCTDILTRDSLSPGCIVLKSAITRNDEISAFSYLLRPTLNDIRACGGNILAVYPLGTLTGSIGTDSFFSENGSMSYSTVTEVAFAVAISGKISSICMTAVSFSVIWFCLAV